MADDDTASRVALAWRELRRGATGAALRNSLLGPDGPLLEQAQLDALEILASEPDGWRMSEFADAMHVDPSTATRAVNRLQHVGLATRTKDPNDLRVVIAGATATGRRMVRGVTARRAIGMERLLEPFDEAERQELAKYFERFVESIDQLVAELTDEL